MIDLVGTWDGFVSNSAGVTKLMLAFSKEHLAQALRIASFNNEEILKMAVTPVDGDTLNFDSLEFYDLKVKSSGDSRVTFRTINEFLGNLSFDDLNNLVDAQVNVVVSEMEDS